MKIENIIPLFLLLFLIYSCNNIGKWEILEGQYEETSEDNTPFEPAMPISTPTPVTTSTPAPTPLTSTPTPTPIPATTPTPTGPITFLEAGGLVVIEAENFSSKIARNSHSWELDTSVTGYSGSGYLMAGPDTELRYDTGYAANSPVVNYNISFTTPGIYYVWQRASCPDGNSDSIHAGLDNTESADSDNLIVTIGTTWQWRKDTFDGPDATITITTGLHELNIWMREDGTNVDKIILTTDAGYTPSGTGPAQSAAF